MGWELYLESSIKKINKLLITRQINNKLLLKFLASFLCLVTFYDLQPAMTNSQDLKIKLFTRINNKLLDHKKYILKKYLSTKNFLPVAPIKT